MKQVNPRSSGFTLIELMVTLTIAAVLLVVAVPSFLAYKRSAELTSAANTLLAALNAARGEAMKRGYSAMVVPTNNGTDWSTGWVVFVDKNNTRTYSDAADTTVLSQQSVPTSISVTWVGDSASTAAPYIMFDASGFSRLKNGGFGAPTLTMMRTDVSGSEQLGLTRRIIVASTGRARMCKPASSNDSNCSSTGGQ